LIKLVQRPLHRLLTHARLDWPRRSHLKRKLSASLFSSSFAQISHRVDEVNV
jgi:hypothetical protein